MENTTYIEKRTTQDWDNSSIGKTLASQAQGSEFNCHCPHKAEYGNTHLYPIAGEAEATRSLGLTGQPG